MSTIKKRTEQKAFNCCLCGECCYGVGGIVLKKAEINQIANFLKLKPEFFLRTYCEKRHGRIYITTKEDDFCIFFDQKKACLIHQVKPAICNLWPFFPVNVQDKETWELAQLACPGINRNCSFEAFVRQSQKCKS